MRDWRRNGWCRRGGIRAVSIPRETFEQLTSIGCSQTNDSDSDSDDESSHKVDKLTSLALRTALNIWRCETTAAHELANKHWGLHIIALHRLSRLCIHNALQEWQLLCADKRDAYAEREHAEASTSLWRMGLYTR